MLSKKPFFYINIIAICVLFQMSLTANENTNADRNLVYAAETGDVALVIVALKDNADVNATNLNGTSVLMTAAAKGYVKIVDILLHEGADSNLKNKQDRTALYASSLLGYTDIVKLLLNHGANVDTYSSDGLMTPLMAAAANNRLEISKILLNKGADITLKNKRGENVFDIVSKRYEPTDDIYSLLEKIKDQ